MQKNHLLTKNWKRIGFYPTPDVLVDQFNSVICNYLEQKKIKKEDLSLLDLFAGDGRLGTATYKTLKDKNYKISALNYIEIEKDQVDLIDKQIGNPEILNQNVFNWKPNKKFDLIVSNPPYLILNSLKAEELGFDWEYVKTHGRNLYTLGILKGLDLCKESGILAVISPFSWLRGEFSQKFRDEINEMCSSVLIKANDHRTVFKDVNQDIGIQIFTKRLKGNIARTDWKFGYNGFKPTNIAFEHLKPERNVSKSQYRTMVGPVVWNRKKKFLTNIKNKNVVVVYGGNIGHDGKLHFDLDRYKAKQYIKKEALLKTDIFVSPVILIRRIMRGIPGNWMIDSCLLEKEFQGTAENHVIVIEIPKERIKSFKAFHAEIMNKVKDYYYLSGSPSISVKVVKQIVWDLLEKPLIVRVKKRKDYKTTLVIDLGKSQNKDVISALAQ